jgi:hypothetical protein
VRGAFAEVLGEPGFVWGEGEAPAELRRFNLAAFAFPGVWCLFQGLYRWWLLFVVRYFVVASVARTVFPPTKGPRSWIALPLTLSEPQRWALYLVVIAASLALDLWFGKTASRLLWRADPQLRVRAPKLGHPNVGTRDVEAYQHSQEGCAKVALTLFAASLATSGLIAFAGPTTWTPLRSVATATGDAVFVGEVLWWWLDRRRATR